MSSQTNREASASRAGITTQSETSPNQNDDVVYVTIYKVDTIIHGGSKETEFASVEEALDYYTDEWPVVKFDSGHLVMLAKKSGVDRLVISKRKFD